MSKDTNIQWADGTVNPTMGCDGCELWNPKNKVFKCYAGTLTGRYAGRKGYPPNFETVTKFPGRMEVASRWGDLRGTERPDKPWLNGWPRTIFISDMSDLLSKSIEFQYIFDEVIKNVTSEHGKRHIWFWLTKRPTRMVEFSEWLGPQYWPTNLWPMTSITSQDTRFRAATLCKVGNTNTTRGLSIEPMMSAVSLKSIATLITGISWAIYGGESGSDPTPCNIAWLAEGLRECREFGIKPFIKQVGTKPFITMGGKNTPLPLAKGDDKGGDWSAWPESLRVREYPKLA